MFHLFTPSLLRVLFETGYKVPSSSFVAWGEKILPLGPIIVMRQSDVFGVHRPFNREVVTISYGLGASEIVIAEQKEFLVCADKMII